MDLGRLEQEFLGNGESGIVNREKEFELLVKQ